MSIVVRTRVVDVVRFLTRICKILSPDDVGHNDTEECELNHLKVDGWTV